MMDQHLIRHGRFLALMCPDEYTRELLVGVEIHCLLVDPAGQIKAKIAQLAAARKPPNM